MHTARWDWPFGARAPGEWRSGRGRRKRLPRWRPPDPWGDDAEAFAGAAALEDAGRRAGNDPTSAARVWSVAVARLAVVQLTEAAQRPTASGLLEEARAAAAGYVREARCGEGDPGGLEAVVALATSEPTPALAAALCEAATTASAAGHVWGAASLWRAAYRLAAPRRWEEEATLSAAGLEGLARAAGSRGAARLWRARALRHARRAAA